MRKQILHSIFTIDYSQRTKKFFPMKKIISFLLLQLIAIAAFAQEPDNGVEMADVMRSNGKIYVVIAVLLTIFAGLLIFLISQEMKLKKLERKINEHISNPK